MEQQPTSQTQSASRRSLRPIPRRAGERLVGAFFRNATKLTGLHPSLIPSHMRRQLEVIGVPDESLYRVLRSMRGLHEWPYVWEAEGDRQLADGNPFLACAAYYVGQRLLITESPLKRRLYRQSQDAYRQVAQPAPLEEVRVDWGEQTVAGVLQVPVAANADAPAPLVVLVPGITATKEELFPFSLPLLRRGYAVCCIDNPGYGDTTGVVIAGSEHNAARVIDHLRNDERIDETTVHLFGTSMGGYWALHAAAATQVNSVVVVSAPFAPARFIETLPTAVLTAIQQMSGATTLEEAVNATRKLTLEHVAPTITAPVKIFFGGRDRTVPLQELETMQQSLGGPHSTTVFERDHHVCLEHIDEIIGETLEWLEDPARIVEHRPMRVVDTVAQRRGGGFVPHSHLAPSPQPS